MEMNDSTNFKTVRGMLSSHRGGPGQGCSGNLLGSKRAESCSKYCFHFPANFQDDDSQGLSSCATWDLIASGADLVRAPLLRTSIDPQGLSCVARFEGLPTPHCRMARGRWNSETGEVKVAGKRWKQIPSGHFTEKHQF
jgi:hypothetical protein